MTQLQILYQVAGALSAHNLLDGELGRLAVLSTLKFNEVCFALLLEVRGAEYSVLGLVLSLGVEWKIHTEDQHKEWKHGLK